MKQIEGNKIPAGNYEGYLWWSDRNSADVIDGEMKETILTNDENPFIVEGFLFSKDDSKTSISIKYVDGQYYAFTTQVTDEELANIADIREYMPNRMECKGLKFLQRWNSKEDKLCEGMSVLVPGDIVFVGFKH